MSEAPAALAGGEVDAVQSAVSGADEHHAGVDRGGALNRATIEPELLRVERVADCAMRPSFAPGRQVACIQASVPGADDHDAIMNGRCRAHATAGLHAPALLAASEIERIDAAVLPPDHDRVADDHG